MFMTLFCGVFFKRVLIIWVINVIVVGKVVVDGSSSSWYDMIMSVNDQHHYIKQFFFEMKIINVTTFININDNNI